LFGDNSQNQNGVTPDVVIHAYKFQHTGGRGRRMGNLRAAWATQQVIVQGTMNQKKKKKQELLVPTLQKVTKQRGYERNCSYSKASLPPGTFSQKGKLIPVTETLYLSRQENDYSH
jgi:hypothetical protein